MSAIYNFNAGPAILPAPVLERAQRELRDYQGRGMSILEMSHRSPEYEAINAEAAERLRRLLGIGEEYHVLFLQGGASMQFAMLPLNFLPSGASADYVLTGAWAEKAYEEALRIGQARVAASTAESGYRRMPSQSDLTLDPSAAYVHITSNETIQGVQWHTWPDVGDVPLVADMSSDILSRPLEMQRFALIYAGAQKNLGPAGVTIVVIRDAFLQRASANLPVMLRYATHVKNRSLYNTPPVFAVYMVNLVLEWIEQQGGLAAMDERNRRKAATLYRVIDESGGFYRGHAAPDHRSLMNVTFRLPDETLEKRFVAEATAQGMVGLAGHRSVGGIRASIYNAMGQEGCDALAAFMTEFMRRYG
ncbi:MAG: 3-phosphoserine/phosphohydroxythreonine transaminase [Roseiflexus sp.]|nr:3-phosphoserine/phosphohydroxythreonine transaminase [Roseiflexus sp.]MDW8146863.1 3-phosphoserine/phosphohydroxythreonine transaminase [Roseiflexaceae bacterium]MDW8234012.1 3-phosphoserine/phosphohydroxythreonine transaminase [Roseiflexaceae bacterium]